MNLKSIGIFFTLFLCLFTNAWALDYIIEKPLPKEKDSFVISYERIKIKIQDQAATVTIEQALKNNSDVNLEATLLFPIPSDGGISNFYMSIDGKDVEGKIMDKDEASKIYEEIVRKLKDPALLEYAGSGLFRVRIYPIPAKGETKIVIKYSQLLSADMGLVKFKLPLTGHSDKWPLKELTVGIDLDSSISLKSFYSPTHELAIKKDGDKHIKASFEASNYDGEKDFLLYYSFSKEDFGTSLLTYRENEDEPGFFLFVASSGEELKKEDIIPKDIVFVLDTSGSMSDENKLVYAKKALAFCLGNLNPKDRFNIISFNSDTDMCSDELMKPSEAEAKKAKKFLEALEPLGGTNIDEAMKFALKQFSDEKRPHYIVFLTDGLPTQGETDMNTILKNISKENKSGVRIFSFGVGTDVNTALLDLMAEQSKGHTSYLEPGEEMESVISSFFTKINHPVLSNLALDFGSVKTKDIYPKELPDLFRGSQILLFGRYTDSGHTAITLSGEVNGEKKKYVWEKTFPAKDSDNSFIPALWATRKIGYLLKEIRLHGENDETVQEIVKLSKRYGIVTPYTSYLIQEEINRKAGENIPVDDEKLYSSMPYTYNGNMSNQDASGAPNVQASNNISHYETAEKLPYKEEGPSSLPTQVASSVKTIADKTFYLKEGKWTDSFYADGTPTEDVEFASEKYFKLLKALPEIGKYLAVGDNLILVYQGKSYHIYTK